jgi:hypothetical protein
MRQPRPEAFRTSLLRGDGFVEPCTRASEAFEQIRNVRLSELISVGEFLFLE